MEMIFYCHLPGGACHTVGCLKSLITTIRMHAVSAHQEYFSRNQISSRKCWCSVSPAARKMSICSSSAVTREKNPSISIGCVYITGLWQYSYAGRADIPFDSLKVLRVFKTSEKALYAILLASPQHFGLVLYIIAHLMRGSQWSTSADQPGDLNILVSDKIRI